LNENFYSLYNLTDQITQDKVEDELVKKLNIIIEHFKQQDPVGLPLIPLEDPMVSKVQK
jgi:hypothetical protein